MQSLWKFLIGKPTSQFLLPSPALQLRCFAVMINCSGCFLPEEEMDRLVSSRPPPPPSPRPVPPPPPAPAHTPLSVKVLCGNDKLFRLVSSPGKKWTD